MSYEEIKTNYVTTKKARELLGVTSDTLRNWDRKGKIVTIRSPTNTRLYSKKDIYRILGIDTVVMEKRKIAYCRVSSKKQMDDLERQCDFFRSEYPDYELVTDIASGINWNRKGFTSILESAMSGKLEEVVVAHRDRLCRFAFELVEFIFKSNRVKLIVLDKTEHKHSETELADDILSIVHVYACRNMGRRRYKKQENQNLSKSNATKEIKGLDKHNEVCL